MQSLSLTTSLKSSKVHSKKTWISEFFLYDQFSDNLLPLIKDNQTASSICGYTAIANAVKAAELFSKNMISEQVIQALSEVSQVYFMIDLVMKTVAGFRSEYMSNFPQNFKAFKQRESYMRDWVANYEISDYIQQIDPELTKNLYFFRNVAYDHPQEMEKIENEEAVRVVEELQFKGKLYFIEQFYPKRELIQLNEFKQIWAFNPNKQQSIFIIDLLGHYNIVLYGISQGNVVISMCDTTRNSYIEKEAFKTLVSLLLD